MQRDKHSYNITPDCCTGPERANGGYLFYYFTMIVSCTNMSVFFSTMHVFMKSGAHREEKKKNWKNLESQQQN